VAFSPNGQTIAAGENNTPDIGLWNTATGKTATLPEGITVYGVAFSRDGQTIAAGDGDGDVGLWDTATGKPIAVLNEGSPVTGGVAFSPNSQTIAAGDNAGDVGLWDTTTGKPIAVLNEGSPVKSVAFSRDGRTIAAGDEGDVAVLLRPNLSNLTYDFFSRLICSEVRENMTEVQWAANAPGQPYQKTCPADP
jgi:WD40 repeat protein